MPDAAAFHGYGYHVGVAGACRREPRHSPWPSDRHSGEPPVALHVTHIAGRNAHLAHGVGIFPEELVERHGAYAGSSNRFRRGALADTHRGYLRSFPPPLGALDGDFLHTFGEKSPRGSAWLTNSARAAPIKGMREPARHPGVVICGCAVCYQKCAAIADTRMAR